MRSIRGIWVLLALMALARASALRAQEVRYVYDELNRLVAVVDQVGRTAIYEYDAVGNILAIRRRDATGAVEITLVRPTTGIVGSRVQIFGKGFSEVPAENQIAFNGAPGPVLGANSNQLVTEVPAGARTGRITVNTPLGSAVSPEDFTVPGNVFVAPAQARVVVRERRLFTATVTGTAEQRVLWSVNKVSGGNELVGTITSQGVYTAPSSVPTPAVVKVRATSVLGPSLFGEADVTIVAEGNAFAVSAVSVRFGPLSADTVVQKAVSVSFGPISVDKIIHKAVSVQFGPPSVGVIWSAPVSVARGPVIREVMPASGARGTTIALTLRGANLSGATDLAFLLNGLRDSSVTVSNLTVSPEGNELTATVAIGGPASPGPRILLVRTPAGFSTAANTGANVFTVSQPCRQGVRSWETRMGR